MTTGRLRAELLPSRRFGSSEKRCGNVQVWTDQDGFSPGRRACESHVACVASAHGEPAERRSNSVAPSFLVRLARFAVVKLLSGNRMAALPEFRSLRELMPMDGQSGHRIR